MKQDEIARCLVLVYASSNSQMHVNYSIQCEQVDRLCLIEPAKSELVQTLRSLAYDVERGYPTRGALLKELAIYKEAASIYRRELHENSKSYGGGAMTAELPYNQRQGDQNG